jgi:hypothetical protein
VLLVLGGVAEVAGLVPTGAPLFVVEDELFGDDPQPVSAIADASARASTGTLFIGRQARDLT